MICFTSTQRQRKGLASAVCRCWHTHVVAALTPTGLTNAEHSINSLHQYLHPSSPKRHAHWCYVIKNALPGFNIYSMRNGGLQPKPFATLPKTYLAMFPVHDKNILKSTQGVSISSSFCLVLLWSNKNASRFISCATFWDPPLAFVVLWSQPMPPCHNRRSSILQGLVLQMDEVVSTVG